MKNKRVLPFIRKIYLKIFKSSDSLVTAPLKFDCIGQEASDLIKQKLLGDEPVMICRFGWGELDCVASYLNGQKGFEKNIQYIRGEINTFWWDEAYFSGPFHNSGIFPVKFDIFNRFGKLMIEDMKYVDVLGSWLKDELYFKEELKRSVKVRLIDLEPYYHTDPWSEALKGKKILVIHPFDDSIKSQYSNRKLLFKDERVLPEFELITLKAVQSIAKNETGFNDWFEALESMKDKISNIDFDIAIIGCGAYGFPLAAHVKRIGKKAVHLGGATQALFGITGKRWEENDVAKLINEHWVRPLQVEVPKNSESIEGDVTGNLL